MNSGLNVSESVYVDNRPAIKVIRFLQKDTRNVIKIDLTTK